MGRIKDYYEEEIAQMALDRALAALEGDRALAEKSEQQDEKAASHAAGEQ